LELRNNNKQAKNVQKSRKYEKNFDSNKFVEFDFYRSLAVARIWSNNMIDVTKDQKSCLTFIFEVF